MKKFLVAMAITLCFVSQAMAFTFAPGSETDGYPGSVGTQSTTKIIIWDIKDRASVGAYFFIKFTDGDATSSSIKFSTSYLATGDTDWTVYAPRDATTTIPTDYTVTMPSASKTWMEPIPFPIYARRVKAVYTISSDSATDAIVIKMMSANK